MAKKKYTPTIDRDALAKATTMAELLAVVGEDYQSRSKEEQAVVTAAVERIVQKHL